jgi:hypothetical protein
MERQSKSWSELKHQASKKTDVHNLIRGIMESDLKVPANPHKPMCNLGLGKVWLRLTCAGEPTKENGYELPTVIGEAVIDVIKTEKLNGYTHSSGSIEARKAIVEKYTTFCLIYLQLDSLTLSTPSQSTTSCSHTDAQVHSTVLFQSFAVTVTICLCLDQDSPWYYLSQKTSGLNSDTTICW